MNTAELNSEQAIAPESDSIAIAPTRQFLTFVLAGEEYGVDILRVHEIRGWSAVTHIPNTEAYVQGVLNLRGTIVPIMDLRMRFGMDKIDYTATTVVIVLSVNTEVGNRIIGIVVDGVSDVVEVPADGIQPAGDFSTAGRTEFINGLATVGEHMIILLETDGLFDVEEVAGGATVN